jgi:hypothetical protein
MMDDMAGDTGAMLEGDSCGNEMGKANQAVKHAGILTVPATHRITPAMAVGHISSDVPAI